MINNKMLFANNEIIAKAIQDSHQSPRKRACAVLRGFRAGSPSILVNALQPGTYVRPHRHPQKGATEILVANRGLSNVLFLNDSGQVIQNYTFSADSDSLIEVPEKTYHTVITLEPDTVLFDIYMLTHKDDAEYKEFAPWAPEEGSDNVKGYLESLVNQQQNL